MSILQPIQVVLADDHAMVRQALAQILDESSTIRVIGQAADGKEALARVEKLTPDVLVLDYSLPDTDAPTLIPQILSRHPRIKILVLTIHENIHYAMTIMDSGAQGYIVKSAAMAELVEGIQTVYEGETYVSPKVSQRVFAHLRTGRTKAGLDTLSPREMEVLRMLGSGFGIKECARRLDVSVSAASTYRARLMEKLKLQTTAEIIRFAIENDLVG